MPRLRRSGRNAPKEETNSQNASPKEEEATGSEASEKSREVSEAVSGNGEEEKVEKNEESEDESSDEEDETPIVFNVTQRSKRATAGNKMAALLTSADHEDEFYKTAYGGFAENDDVDMAFESPAHSDDDEVDSDFDKEEEEDEPASGDEKNDEEKPRRKKKKFMEPKRGLTADDILAKNRKWAMSRLAGNVVAANTVDAKTQAQMLKESETTEKNNVESLKKYEAFELEKKKKREKVAVRIFPPGPRVQIKMTRDGTAMTYSEIKKFEHERPKPQPVCAVTGRPAKYIDPITKLPYSTAYAFKVIRDKYNKFLMGKKDNVEVIEYLKRLKQQLPPVSAPVVAAAPVEKPTTAPPAPAPAAEIAVEGSSSN